MIKIIKVKKNDNDGLLIMKWRNDIKTRNMSFYKGEYTWSIFKNIFYNKYFSNSIDPLFLEYNNIKIALVSFYNKEICNNHNNHNIYISINISPSYRGQGLSKLILNRCINYVKFNYPNILKIIAEIKEINTASIRTFTNLDFQLFKKYNKDNENILVYIYNMDNIEFLIGDNRIGHNYPIYFIAELSCNHNQDISTAYKLIDEAHKSGANSIKLQTYTADTMTIKCDRAIFKDCLKDTVWEGETLHDLYSRAYTPWKWHAELKTYANKLGMDLFSSPFDVTAVDFLEKLDMPCYKIASFEIVDHVLIKRIAQTGKPVIISSGMASRGDLEAAVNLLREHGCKQICMLKCTSAYPAKPEDANLITLKNMAETFNVIPGLSDHTLGIEVPITAIALGAKVIEKHFTLSRDSGSADDAFSLTPNEFKQMVDSARIVEKSIGKVTYGGVKNEESSKKFRKSLFFVEDIKKGELITKENMRPIRPGYGLHTKYYDEIIGKKVTQDIERGTPVNWNLFV